MKYVENYNANYDNDEEGEEGMKEIYVDEDGDF